TCAGVRIGDGPILGYNMSCLNSRFQSRFKISPIAVYTSSWVPFTISMCVALMSGCIAFLKNNFAFRSPAITGPAVNPSFLSLEQVARTHQIKSGLGYPNEGVKMAWVYLSLAGILEVVWAFYMKKSE